MRRVYVSDYVPARRISADYSTVPVGPSLTNPHGVGAVVAQLSSAAIAARAARTKGQKPKAPPLTLPRVKNGPLAQRVEPAKTSLKGTSGYLINGVGRYGVRDGWAIYNAEFKRQEQGLIAAITATQTQLDKIDSTTIGVDTQLGNLQNAAGNSAPSDVQAAIDAAVSARRDMGDMVDGLKAQIDSLNNSADMVKKAEASGQAGPFSPAQQALEKAYKDAQGLDKQVTAIQRSGKALAQLVDAATQTTNKYVDTINAQAAALVAQQQQQAQATDIAYQLTDQQKQLAAAQAAQQQQIAQQAAGQQQTITQQQADQAAQMAQLQAQLQAQMQAQLQAQQTAFQQQLAAMQAQQQQYQPPYQPQYQPPPPVPQYPGGAQYTPSYPPPSSPVQIVPDGFTPAPQQQYDPTQYYQTPQYGGEAGPGAGPDWTTYVEGMRGSRGVGFDPVVMPTAPPQQFQPVTQPSASAGAAALAAAQARQVLAQANLKIADARKQIEAQRLADEAKAKAKAAPPADTSWWTPTRKVLGVAAAALTGAAAAYELGKGRRK